MSNQASLSAATQDRKARLAQLKSLKRKQPTHDDTDDRQEESLEEPSAKKRSPSPANHTIHLSGRNYDAETRAPKLGFETTPVSKGQATLESQAAAIAEEARKAAEKEREEEETGKGLDGAAQQLDLFKLQPKKPNWDLKRDLQRKLDVLNVRTDNAIAKLVRERIENAKREKEKENRAADDGDEAAGLSGEGLVGAMRELEREEKEANERERMEEEEEEEEESEEDSP